MQINSNDRQKIVVTGHTGFKGVWLCALMRELGYEVIGISDEIRDDSLYSKVRKDLNLEEYFCDVSNPNILTGIIRNINPLGIIHLAAQPLVIESYRNPYETFNSNIMGTVNVILAAYEATNIKFVIAVTTDKVYENNETHHAFIESDKLGGHDPYSASKAAAELVAKSLRHLPGRETNFRIVTARAGNVIGGGDDAKNRLLPDFFRTVLKSEPVLIRNPQSVRPWQHVLDPLWGYLQIAQQVMNNLPVSDAYNFGPSQFQEMSVLEVCRRASKYWGDEQNIELKNLGSNNYREAEYLAISAEKAHQELGWTTILNTEDAIKWTVEWEKSVNLENRNPYDTMLNQIRSYLHLIN